jgi:hypothetical protein
MKHNDDFPPSAFRSKRRCGRASAVFDCLEARGLPARGEKSLWIAVINQVVTDALSGGNGSEAAHVRHQARCWLEGRSGDFETVCQLAGFDPDWLRGKLKKLMASPRRWRLEAGKGKRYAAQRLARLKKRRGGGGGENGGGNAMPFPGSLA